MSLPFLTADLPGTGGTLKEQPEDFLVEELPAYEPSGVGEHLFLWIEKRDLPHEQLIRRLSRGLGLPVGDVGTAGLKDRRAVTRQYVSVPARCEERVPAVEAPDLRVLRHARHGNKLRTGHLRGNRFSILVRHVGEDAWERAQAVAVRLARLGAPNYFGEQRFGRDDQTLATGLDLLRGVSTPRDLPGARRKFLLRLSLSAVQSWLFNRALAERLADGLLHRALLGDVMQVAASGGLFVVEDAAEEQRRFELGETVVTGPMFGPKMRQPAGEPARREARVLEACGLAAEDFQRFARLTSGTRRPFLVRPDGLRVSAEPDGLRFEFTLPSGVYATVVLREFQKPAAVT